MSNGEINYIIQYDFDTQNPVEEINTIKDLLEKLKKSVPNIKILSDELTNEQNIKINIPVRYKLFKLSDFFLSSHDRKNVFEPIIADWQEELYEALYKNQKWKARAINFRYTYAFFIAMWQRISIFNLSEMNSSELNKSQITQQSIKSLFIKKGLSVENTVVLHKNNISEMERERLSKVFSSPQQISDLINEDREER